jgi:hypothetical protein
MKIDENRQVYTKFQTLKHYGMMVEKQEKLRCSEKQVTGSL